MTARMDGSWSPSGTEAVALDTIAGDGAQTRRDLEAVGHRHTPAQRTWSFWRSDGPGFDRMAKRKFETTLRDCGFDGVALVDPSTGATGDIEVGIRLIDAALPGFADGPFRKVEHIATVTGRFLSGTALGIPRTVFLGERIRGQGRLMAEHLLHETVHVMLNSNYFRVFPFRRDVSLLGPVIGAPWHNRDLGPEPATSWWGIEKSLHAFAVYAHLALLQQSLLAGEHAAYAREQLPMSMFCTHYLGERLLIIGDRDLTAQGREYVEGLLARVPLTGGVRRGLGLYAGRGLVDAVVDHVASGRLAPVRPECLVRRHPACLTAWEGGTRGLSRVDATSSASFLAGGRSAGG